MYRQQWQADQQKQIISGKSNDGKVENNGKKHHNTNGGLSGGRQGNNDR
jgi:hypothetical protein